LTSWSSLSSSFFLFFLGQFDWNGVRDSYRAGKDNLFNLPAIKSNKQV
jgi:hypothetical protein